MPSQNNLSEGCTYTRSQKVNRFFYLFENGIFHYITPPKAKNLRKRIIINFVIEVVILFVSLIILADILINDTIKIKLYYIVAPLAVQSILLFSFLKFFEKTYPEEKSETGQ